MRMMRCRKILDCYPVTALLGYFAFVLVMYSIVSKNELLAYLAAFILLLCCVTATIEYYYLGRKTRIIYDE